MRSLILAVCVMLTAQHSHAQTFACASTENMLTPALINYNYAAGYAHRHRRHLEPLILAGGITASLGGIATGIGAFYFYTAFDTYDGTAPVDKPRENLGTGIMIAGGIVTVGGLVMLVAGKRKSDRAYTWQPIAPKMNEVGFAYNFK